LAPSEALRTAAFLPTRPPRAGGSVTGAASYFEPSNVAGPTATLCHVDHGRAAGELTPRGTAQAARDYSRTEATPDAASARGPAVVETLRKLWDSGEDDAFIRNKQTGEYVDGSKIHPINHEGAQFRIKGPVNVARPPQGQVVVA